jgi:hypothetical protein
VLNPSSHAVVETEIVAPDRVRVTPGSTPLLQTGGRARQFTSNSFGRPTP